MSDFGTYINKAMPPRKVGTKATPTRDLSGKSTPVRSASPAVSAPSSAEAQISVDISKYFESVSDKQKDRGKKEEGIFITEKNLKQLITDAVESAIASCLDMLKREAKVSISEDLEKVEGSIHETRVEIEKQAKAVKDAHQKAEFAEQNSCTALNKTRVTDQNLLRLRNELNDLEQYTRRSHVRILGLEEKTDETPADLLQTVSSLIKDQYRVPLLKDDIEACHRIGRLGRGPRSVIVRFLRRGTKDVLFSKMKEFRKPGIRVYHDLTYINSRMLYDTKQHPRIESAWASFSGHIMAKGHNGEIFRVNMMTDINCELDKRNK